MKTYREWVEHKIEIAEQLEAGALGGSYAESAIILCTTISAMSSLLWSEVPRNDRKKFTELIVIYGKKLLSSNKISCPLLCMNHPKMIEALDISTISLHHTGNIDKTDQEILSRASTISYTLTLRDIRAFSYANLLYTQIRCGFIHEYQSGKNSSATDYLRIIGRVEQNSISYVNKGCVDGNELVRNRLIHFPIQWISEIALTIADALDHECYQEDLYVYQDISRPAPASWWIEG